MPCVVIELDCPDGKYPFIEDTIAVLNVAETNSDVHRCASLFVGGPLIIHMVGELFKAFPSVRYGTLTDKFDKVLLVVPNDTNEVEMREVANNAATFYDENVSGFEITEEHRVCAMGKPRNPSGFLSFAYQNIEPKMDGTELCFPLVDEQEGYDLLAEAQETPVDMDGDDVDDQMEEEEPTPDLPSDSTELCGHDSFQLDTTPVLKITEAVDDMAEDPQAENEFQTEMLNEDDFLTQMLTTQSQGADSEDPTVHPPWVMEQDVEAEPMVVLPHMLPDADYDEFKGGKLRERFMWARENFADFQTWMGASKEPWILKRGAMSNEHKCALFDLTAALLQQYMEHGIGVLVCRCSVCVYINIVH
jgi:hypothetical protein